MDKSISVASIIDKLPPSWKDFKHTLKHGKDDLSLVQLGSHLRIEESLRAQDSDKGKGKEVGGPSVNMTEEGKNKHNKQNKCKKQSNEKNSGSSFNKKPKLECWKCGKTGHFKKGCQSVNKKNANAGGSGKGLMQLSILYMGDDHFAHVYGKGSVVLEFSLGKYITLFNVLYVPKLRFGYYNNGMFMLNLNKVPDDSDSVYMSFSSTVVNSSLWLPDPKRKTLGEKGIDCIFVGYAEHSKAYRFYVIKPNEYVSINSIIESRDVIFDENRFSSIPRPKDIMPNSVESQREDHSDDVLSEIPKPRKAIHNPVIHQMDVKIAFLNGDLDEEVYMKQPKGFVMPGKEHKSVRGSVRYRISESRCTRRRWTAHDARGPLCICSGRYAGATLVYPEFMPPEDDVPLAKEQPLPASVSPTTDSPGYITESNPEEYPEKDDENPKEDPSNYPTDRDDDDDDDEEEEESSGDDADEEEEDEDEDKEEEEEHLASADSVDRFLAISTPPSSPPASCLSPLPQIPSQPLPVSLPLPMSPPPLPASPTYQLGYRAAMIRLRAESQSTSHPLPLQLPIVLLHTRASMAMMRGDAPSTYILASRSETPQSGIPPLLPIPLPTSSLPLLLPSTDCRVDVLECSSASTARPIGGFRIVYGFVGTLDAEIRRDPDREIDFVTTARQDTDEIYGRLDDVHDDRLLMSGHLNLLRRDRGSHSRTTRLIKGEVRASRKAWVQSMDASSRPQETDTAHRGTDSAKDIADSDGVANVLAEREATKSINGEDSHDSGMGEGDKLYLLELALMCARMFPEESNKIERYVGGLPDMIHRRSGEKKPYGGSKPLCSKFNYHHDGQCALRCHKCNRVGHLARDCRSTANANTANNQRGTRTGQKPTCFECGAQRYFKKECPKLKNNNRGNQVGNGNAAAKVYAVGHAGINPDSNVITGTFLLSNCYASILFDTGADRSFMSTAFSSLINITPTTLDHYYDVELADERIIRLNTIIRGFTLNFLNHPFNINLIPIELGSFDVIIGMDWLAKYQAVIVCGEKIIRIP
ncbi:putative reverse transcriptase domain-containing protein [Tanacetum coccineum]